MSSLSSLSSLSSSLSPAFEMPPPKEDRSDWVAVESDVAGKSGPTIKSGMNAYMFYQKQNLSDIGKELKESDAAADFGAVQQATAARWKALSAKERAPYEALAAADKARAAREHAARDAEITAEREAARAAAAAPVTGPRDRKVLHAAEPKKERVKKDLTADQLARKAEREAGWARAKAERQAEEAILEKQKAQLRAEHAKAGRARLKYLLGQSDVFKHFGLTDAQDEADTAAAAAAGGGGGGAAAAAAAKSPPASPSKRRVAPAAAASSSSSAAAALASPMRGSTTGMVSEKEEDKTLAEDDVGANVIRYTEHPAFVARPRRTPDQPPMAMRPYQVEGLNWMIQLSKLGLNGILADEMGLGKTLQSISILAYHLAVNGSSGPHLVVCPKSCLSNWMQELKRWAPELRPVSLHGGREEREVLLEGVLRPRRLGKDREFDVCITTYEMINIERATLGKHVWEYFIIDEAHRLKNDESLFSQSARDMLARYRLLLTGTPLQNNLHELWALLNFLMPEVFGSSEDFDKFFDLDTEDEDSKKSMIHQLHRVLRPFMLRRLKVDVEKSLPPKTETLLFVGMSEMQRGIYKKILLRDSEALTSGKKGAKGKGTLQNIVMQLRKTCNHPYLFDGVEDMELDPLGEHLIANCGKLCLLTKLLTKLKARGSRVLVFSQMTRVLDVLEDFMRMPQHAELGSYCRIDGGTAHEDREQQIDEFNEPGSKHFLFMLSTRAGGLGINLWTADTVVLYDSDWNPQADLQAQDRAHRIGQKKPVQVYRFVTDASIEEKIVERAQQKLKLDAVVMQSGRLPDASKGASSEDMLAAIRFGADKVFRSEGSTVTDDDIDLILSQGEKRTEEMQAKLSEHVEKGDVLDFKFDQGFNTNEFEGVDYKKDREELKALLNEQKIYAVDAMGKRERKQVQALEPEDWGGEAVSAKPKHRHILPKTMRLPRMDAHQFFDRPKLLAVQEKEEARFLELSQMTDLPEGYEMPKTYLEPEEEAEKERLLAEGFYWTRNDLQAFIRASSRFGRDQHAQIAREVGKPEADVTRYSSVFWAKGALHLPEDVWRKAHERIEIGERKLKAVEGMREATRLKVARFRDNPWETMVVKNPRTRSSEFTTESCRYLLTFVQIYGYGNWARIHAAVRRCEAFRFDLWLRSRSVDEIRHECERLMKEAEKENAEALKKGEAERRRLENEAEERRAFLRRDAQEQQARDDERKKVQDQVDKLTKKFEEECQARLKLLDEGKSMAEANSPLVKDARKKQAAASVLGGGSSSAGSSKGGGGGGGGASSSKSAGGISGGRSKVCTLSQGMLGMLVDFVLCQSDRAMGVSKLASDFNAMQPTCPKRQVSCAMPMLFSKEKRSGDLRESWYLKPEHEHLRDGGGGGAPAGEGGPAKKLKLSKSPKAKAQKGTPPSALPLPSRVPCHATCSATPLTHPRLPLLYPPSLGIAALPGKGKKREVDDAPPSKVQKAYSAYIYWSLSNRAEVRPLRTAQALLRCSDPSCLCSLSASAGDEGHA